MSKRTCTIDGCAKPHRARGLCTTHYNHKYQPNRHEKKLVACIWCGAEKLKHSGGGRKYGQTCSEECRMAITYPPKCDLPPDHWALWYGASSQWPRYGWQSCAQCGGQFTARSSTSRYCSNPCAWIASDRRKGVRSADEIAAEVRHCARCNNPYNSPHVQRIHCSDLCREMDRMDRGIGLYHGWISQAERNMLYQRDSYVCWICHKVCDTTVDAQRHNDAPTLDHLVPRSKGGTHEHGNLRTACRGCNSRRGDRDAHEFGDADLIEKQALQLALF